MEAEIILAALARRVERIEITGQPQRRPNNLLLTGKVFSRKEDLMTTSVPLIGVTGSTGQLGGRVAARLAALGQPQRLLVRNLARAPQLPGAEVVQAAYEDGPSS